MVLLRIMVQIATSPYTFRTGLSVCLRLLCLSQL